MTTWVVFLRGVNVGGTTRLPMAELRAALTDDGFDEVRTYIQSGNVVLDDGEPDGDGSDTGRARVAERIGAVLRDRFGHDVAMVVLRTDELAAAIASIPYPLDDPRSVHLFFLTTDPGDDAAERLARLRELALDGEEVELVNGVLHLHSPAGIGRSKLAANVDRHLGVTTARNARTAITVAALAND